MKFLLKSMLILMFFLGFYLSFKSDPLKEGFYYLSFLKERASKYICNIVLQNGNLYKDGELREYHITIYPDLLINDPIKNILDTSNFKLLNLMGGEYSKKEDSNLLILNGNNIEPNYLLSKDHYKFYKYNDVFISYMNPSLLNSRDLFHIERDLSMINGISLSPVILKRDELNEKFLPYLLNDKNLFIILGDTLNLNEVKNYPLLTLTSYKDNIFYINKLILYIKDNSLVKLRVNSNLLNGDGAFISGEPLKEILSCINTFSKIKFHISENADYIFTEYDILKK